MAKVIFICGFIGSGKTTYAKQLADTEPAFRFSIDEWMIPLYGEHMEREVFDARLATLTELFQRSALEMIKLNVSVIFDYGLWRRSDRVAMLAWANQHNLEAELHYLDVDFETCQQRALSRNSQRENKAYEMTPEMLDMFWTWFETPDSNEHVISINSGAIDG